MTEVNAAAALFAARPQRYAAGAAYLNLHAARLKSRLK
jgi:hypothetical protein